MSQLRVLHLMGALRPSGMERMFVSASPHFHELEITSLIVGQGRMHPFSGMLKDANYEVLTISRLRSMHGAKELFNSIRKFKPDIVHIHTEGAFAVSTLAVRLSTRAPIVRTIHNVFQPQGRALLSRSLQSWIADRFISRFVAPSPDVAINERAFGRNAKVILNWVANDYLSTASYVYGQDSDGKSAVIVGNCSTIKNHDLVLRSLVKGGYRVFHHGDEAEASTEELDLLNTLESRGELMYRGTSAPLESLSQANVYVMPSTREGMPVALAEAISMGVPCLIADSPGVQWATGIDGIQHIGLDQRDWDQALPPSGYVRKNSQLAAPDLSASRGAREYVELYSSLVTPSPMSPATIGESTP
ncbi:glycosyltransferase [Arthrobacter sp. SO3]|uniref:glycosyltransferase n=1 Tax=Arthrobacter sp. SO3 TaxID=1897057 RepID=UPI001D0011D6|nr:glycosyltransferase [Arthrobacter sp. SO3]MCB5291207.1 putative glycosyltransferase EpsF [Arthrobacter sp. SO3]